MERARKDASFECSHIKIASKLWILEGF